jgi:hypothetical protein
MLPANMFQTCHVVRPHPKLTLWLLAGYTLAIGSVYALI